MSMNIKNEEAHRLAREVAQLTGESLTEAVTVALRERLDRLIPAQTQDVEDRIKAMMSLVEEMAPYAALLPPSDQIGELLYDEQGLPT
jgi:antitoxin VapB